LWDVESEELFVAGAELDETPKCGRLGIGAPLSAQPKYLDFLPLQAGSVFRKKTAIRSSAAIASNKAPEHRCIAAMIRALRDLWATLIRSPLLLLLIDAWDIPSTTAKRDERKVLPQSTSVRRASKERIAPLQRDAG